jgi:hypothetical protein
MQTQTPLFEPDEILAILRADYLQQQQYDEIAQQGEELGFSASKTVKL